MRFVPDSLPPEREQRSAERMCMCAPECMCSGPETRPVPIISSSRFPEYSGALNAITASLAAYTGQCHAIGTAAMVGTHLTARGREYVHNITSHSWSSLARTIPVMPMILMHHSCPVGLCLAK